MTARSEVPALPRASGAVIYRDTGREHRQEGDRAQPAGWERRFCCPVEYSTSLVMLSSKSKVGCSDFPSGTQAQCHSQWEPHTAPFSPAYSLGNLLDFWWWKALPHALKTALASRHPLHMQLCWEPCTGSLLPAFPAVLPSSCRSRIKSMWGFYRKQRQILMDRGFLWSCKQRAEGRD